MDYAGVLIENNKGKILFQLRDNKPNIPNPGLWAIFGGGMNPGETPKKTAIREIKEELGLVIKKENLKKLITIPVLRKKYHIFYLKTNKKIQEFTLKEGSSMKFMNRKELLKKRNVVPIVRYFFLIYPLLSKFLKRN